MASKKRDGVEASPASDSSYADDSAELEQILDDLEQRQIDIDVLSEKVSRAADLIKRCRDKLGGAEMRVKTIVDGMNGAEQAEPDQ